MAVKTILKNAYDFDNLIFLLNEDASANKMREIFIEILQDETVVGRQDRVLIYFSGHGKLRKRIWIWW